MKKINKTQAAIFNIELTTKTTFKENKGDNRLLLDDVKRTDSEIKKINLTDDRTFFIITFQYKSNNGFNKFARLYELIEDGTFYDRSYYFIKSKNYKTNDIGVAYSISNCWGFSLFSHINDAKENLFDFSKF